MVPSDGYADRHIGRKLSLLEAIAQACLGTHARVVTLRPGGRHCADGDGTVAVASTTSSRLIEAMSFDTPLVELVVKASAGAQIREHEDGGSLCLALAARLATVVLRSQRDAGLVLEGMHTALSLCGQAMQADRQPRTMEAEGAGASDGTGALDHRPHKQAHKPHDEKTTGSYPA